MKNNDNIRQADRKALPKFLLLLVVGAVLGVILGLAGLVLLKSGNVAAVLDSLRTVVTLSAPWAIMVCFAVQLLTGLALHRKAKAVIDGWDGEDEAVSARAEYILNIGIWVSSMVNILSWFFLPVMYAADSFVKFYGAPLVLGGLAAHFATLMTTVILQKNYVNLTKRLYPEKTASALDPKFQKKWLADCDEAERAQIGECAYHAYSAVNQCCMILWLVFTLTALFLKTGILPVLAVCVIWAVSQSVYLRWCMKVSGNNML